MKISLHSLVLGGAEWIQKETRVPFFDLLVKYHILLQFIEFALIGAIGTGVNYLVFITTIPVFGVNFAWFYGIIVATISNFFLNKYLVFDN
jgi:putative flippase GtrA